MRSVLQRDLKADPGSWGNADLPSFLEAMGGWVSDMEGYYRNLGEKVPGAESLHFAAVILAAAKTYE